MKKFALLLALALLLTGCAQAIPNGTQAPTSSQQPTDSQAPTASQAPSTQPPATHPDPGTLPPLVPAAVSREDRVRAADFALRLTSAAAKKGENTLVSPMSVLFALAVTANGAAGETRQQMESVLGAPVDRLNGYLSGLRQAALESGALNIANAVWCETEELVPIRPDFETALRDWYGAELFRQPFTRATLEQINQWVKKQTDGQIEEILSDLPQETVMCLVNALSFDSEWVEPFREDQIGPADFTQADGTVKETDFLYGTESVYLENQLATGFRKDYAGGDFAFVALLPKEGVTPEEVLAGLDGESLQALLEGAEAADVHLSMPMFQVEGDYALKEILTAMGMPDAFEADTADFSHMSPMPLYIGQVVHKTSLTLTAMGTRAGAATAVMMDAAGALDPNGYKSVQLDRPFVYMIIHSETNLPVFIGILNAV